MSYSSVVKQYNNTNTNWWLRTACHEDNLTFEYAMDNGSWVATSANRVYGVSPAFRIA